MTPYNPAVIIPDALLWGKDSAFDVEGFLKARRSCLYAYRTDEGESPAELIQRHTQRFNVDPRGLLVRLQVEQSLISSRKITRARQVDYALGFGATDGGDILRYKGFGKQIEAYCVWMDSRREWAKARIGKPIKTLDGVKITPQSAAAAALLAYTPWEGSKRFKQYSAPFGNKLVYIAAQKYFPF